MDPELLWFSCALPGGGALTGGADRDAFVEGLWEGDVAELFIKGRGERYQEINLSPKGAWWSMTLAEYRKREQHPRRPECVQVETTVEGDRWEVVAAFKRSTLDVDLVAGCQVHVSGMWYRPEPTYLSSNPPRGIEPDYHHHKCFSPISWVDLSA